MHALPLPEHVKFHLFFAYKNEDKFKPGDNSDGVIPLKSQLDHRAESSAVRSYGFDATHVGVLSDRGVSDRVNSILSTVVKPKMAGKSER
jgi:hypothetical protein